MPRVLGIDEFALERFGWTMPGEQRVAVIVRPVKVRHIVGVERFRPGGPVLE
ncbi:hypothetical protein ACFU6K_22605 [Kitasatospora sp. NPDC057512]|uniref:hypothetical protein n=1 Tax=Kitasatospora sp. NPDC057512 TaxID=3346154 RepID=UPI0036BFD424